MYLIAHKRLESGEHHIRAIHLDKETERGFLTYLQQVLHAGGDVENSERGSGATRVVTVNVTHPAMKSRISFYVTTSVGYNKGASNPLDTIRQVQSLNLPNLTSSNAGGKASTMQVKSIQKPCRIQKNEVQYPTFKIGRVDESEVGKVADLVAKANEGLAEVGAQLDTTPETITISKVVELGLQTAAERKVRKMFRENLIASGTIEGATGGATAEPEAFEEF